MKLHQLPNGSWIDLQTVTAIRPLPTEQGGSGSLHRARIVIHHGQHWTEILTANDNEHAQAMADHYAGLVNENCENPATTPEIAPKHSGL